MFIENRTLTKAQMATKLGCNAKSLAPKRCPQLAAAMGAFRALDLPRGKKAADGGMEAWDDEE